MQLVPALKDRAKIIRRYAVTIRLGIRRSRV